MSNNIYTLFSQYTVIWQVKIEKETSYCILDFDKFIDAIECFVKYDKATIWSTEIPLKDGPNLPNKDIKG